MKIEAVVSYLLQGPERSTLFWWLAIINNEDCTPEEALAGLRRILAERSGR